VEREGAGSRRQGTLVLFPGALGDAVCAEPAVRWLARDEVSTFCARGAAAEVAALFPCRPHVRSLDAPEIARAFAPSGGEAREALGWIDGFAAIVSFTGATNAVFREHLESTGRALVLPFPARKGPVHACDEMLAAVGAPPGTAATPALVPPHESGASNDGARPRLVLHPGSGGAAKRVPEVLLRGIAERWRRASGGSTTVLLGPAEVGEERRWEGQVDRVLRPGSIRGLVAALGEAHAYVGCDSGPSHVAAALGIATTTVFTTTAPERFGPRGSHSVHVDLRGAHDGALERVWAAVHAALP